MVAPLLLFIKHLPQMLQALQFHGMRQTFHVKHQRYPETTTKRNATQPNNCFSCFWQDATVLVAILVDHTKGRSPQKGHLWPRNYTPCVQLCQEFLLRFFKNFFLHTVPTIPKLDVLLRCIAWDKSKAILNCSLFTFSLKMILNLILKLNLKMIFDLKTDFESDFESENDLCFT